MPDTVSPETVALVRRRYTEGASLKSIRAESGIARLSVLYRCIDGELDDGSGAPPPPLPRRFAHRGGNRAAMVRRLWSSAEHQVRQVERRLALNTDEPSERDARMLAVLVRTLRELTTLDQMKQNSEARAAAAPDNDDDPVPRDIDEFRRELARRIDAFVQTRLDNGFPDGPEGAVG